MMHDVIVLKKKLQDVAKKYSRSQSWISRLVTKLRNNRNLIEELLAKREERVSLEDGVRIKYLSRPEPTDICRV